MFWCIYLYQLRNDSPFQTFRSLARLTPNIRIFRYFQDFWKRRTSSAGVIIPLLESRNWLNQNIRFCGIIPNMWKFICDLLDTSAFSCSKSFRCLQPISTSTEILKSHVENHGSSFWNKLLFAYIMEHAITFIQNILIFYVVLAESHKQ